LKKFSFELQPVLEFREYEQNEAEGELAKALAVEHEIEENLKIIAQQYASVKARMKDSRNIDDIFSQNQYNRLLDYQKEELLKQLAEAKLVTDEKRKILAECMKKTTALEKLKEMQLDEYKAAAKAKENKQREEISEIKINADIKNSIKK